MFRNRVRDHATRADVAVLADLERSHQCRIAADEGSRADLGRMLFLAVVVTCNGAGPDVDALSDFRVAQIRQVLALRARAETGLLQFDEVAHARFRTDLRVHADTRERSYMRAGIDTGIRNDGIGRDRDLVRQRRGFEDGALADTAFFAD